MTASAPRAVVTVTPNPSLDLTYTLPEVTTDDVEVHRATHSTLEASGKGVNVSRALHGAGVPTCAVLPVGGPTGHYLVELLDAENVVHRIVRQGGDTRVNTTMLRPDGQAVKVNGPGAALTTAEQDALLGATDQALQEAGGSGGETWVAVCGSLPPGVTSHLVTELVQLAHSFGAKCAVDVSGDALRAALQSGADLVAPNREELSTVLNGGLRPAAPLPEVSDVAASLSTSASHLLVSLGRDGALYADGELVLHGTAPPLVPVNTAGAGDALLAGWLSTTTDARSRLTTAIRWGRSACLSATTVDTPPGVRDTEPVVVSRVQGAAGR